MNLRNLSGSKVYRLSRVDPGRRRGLASTTVLPIRPGGPSKSLDEMTSAEFERAMDVYDPPKAGRGRSGQRRSGGKSPANPVGELGLDWSERNAFVVSLIAHLEALAEAVERGRDLKGRLLPANKELAEVRVERLRRAVARLRAWARRHPKSGRRP